MKGRSGSSRAFTGSLLSNPSPFLFYSLSFLLPRRRLALRQLLAIALDHDHAQKAAHNDRAQKNQDDGYANGPDARGEKIV